MGSPITGTFLNDMSISFGPSSGAPLLLPLLVLAFTLGFPARKSARSGKGSSTSSNSNLDSRDLSFNNSFIDFIGFEDPIIAPVTAFSFKLVDMDAAEGLERFGEEPLEPSSPEPSSKSKSGSSPSATNDSESDDSTSRLSDPAPSSVGKPFLRRRFFFGRAMFNSATLPKEGVTIVLNNEGTTNASQLNSKHDTKTATSMILNFKVGIVNLSETLLINN
mmetsp:Transcript_22379/g.31199  ORF Transcript_22379/g.31199 Transcript_22379/m.31199 type:complete len:220 (-) Transcript_22379:129-788(-)